MPLIAPFIAPPTPPVPSTAEYMPSAPPIAPPAFAPMPPPPSMPPFALEPPLAEVCDPTPPSVSLPFEP
jgi:hypothetical protein